MIKIEYEATYTFTNADLLDTSDTVLTFKAKTRHSKEWAEKVNNWINEDQPDPREAVNLMPLAFISITQNGKEYPLDTVEDVKALREAVESQNEGMGDKVLADWVAGHYLYHFKKLDERLTELKKS